MLSHIDIRDDFICICDYICYILYSTPLDPSILIVVLTQPDGKTDDEYKNETDDDFCPSFQQSSQSAHHGLEENPLNEDKDASISDYQSEPKPSTRYTSLEKKQIDPKMLKEKNRNLACNETCPYFLWS